MPMTKREKAARLLGRALENQKRGQFDKAIELYQKAAAADPSWSIPAYNLGLVYKHTRNWKESLTYNRRAVALDPKNEAAWWNFGIAATALGRWNLARSAWRGYGINVPDAEGPIDFPCGFCPIRIEPKGQAEVVWADRVDPARACLFSIPLPESNHRWKDIVLNDGAPNGYRNYQGKEVPVFDELQLLQPSSFSTYVARVKVPPGEKHEDRLPHIADELGGCAEDWSTSLRFICKACSEGRPHSTHDTSGEPAADGMHLIGIAARDRDHATQILSTWQANRADIRIEELEVALEA
jgi:Tetratricopeptide repeat